MPTVAYSMKLVEDNLNGNYELEEMTDETKSQAIGLYSLLISYLRNRPLNLVRHKKQKNGFEAWQRLLREMQPVTRARTLALLTQLSRVQFAEGKSISKQLPLYESIVTEYERISGHTYADDKVASILQAVPALRSHLQAVPSVTPPPTSSWSWRHWRRSGTAFLPPMDEAVPEVERWEEQVQGLEGQSQRQGDRKEEE